MPPNAFVYFESKIASGYKNNFSVIRPKLNKLVTGGIFRGQEIAVDGMHSRHPPSESATVSRCKTAQQVVYTYGSSLRAAATGVVHSCCEHTNTVPCMYIYRTTVSQPFSRSVWNCRLFSVSFLHFSGKEFPKIGLSGTGTRFLNAGCSSFRPTNKLLPKSKYLYL